MRRSFQFRSTDPRGRSTTTTALFMYDSNGNLTQRTDARGIVTSIAYDFLNRPLSKAYSGDDTSGAGYSYDKLRLTAVSTGGVVSRAFTYTPGGASRPARRRPTG